MSGPASPEHGGLPAGILPSLKELIALRPRHASAAPQHVQATQAGRHSTAHLGRGMAFAEVRPYLPGDDVRTVDWRQSARRGRLYTKLFEAERERPLFLLVDLGPEMRFGTRTAFKSVVAARAAAWLAWRACAADDRIGGIVWDGASPRSLPPCSHERSVLALIRALVDTAATPAQPAAETLATPLHHLAAHPTRGSSIVLISDFAHLDAEAESRIKRLAQGAALSLIQVCDPFEMAAPPAACYPVSDGAQHGLLDFRSAAARTRHAADFAACANRLAALARRCAATYLRLATNDDWQHTLSSAFLAPRHRSPAARRLAV